jgi:hypothetical protein
MKIASAFFCVLIMSSVAAYAADARIEPGSKIYVDAADGFDTYLTAALQKKKVPLTVVTDKEDAQYELDGVSEHEKPGWGKMVFMGQIHSDDQASVKLVDLKTHQVLFAYAVNKKNTLHGRQTAAEACAKHLKENVREAK